VADRTTASFPLPYFRLIFRSTGPIVNAERSSFPSLRLTTETSPCLLRVAMPDTEAREVCGPFFLSDFPFFLFCFLFVDRLALDLLFLFLLFLFLFLFFLFLFFSSCLIILVLFLVILVIWNSASKLISNSILLILILFN